MKELLGNALKALALLAGVATLFFGGYTVGKGKCEERIGLLEERIKIAKEENRLFQKELGDLKRDGAELLAQLANALPVQATPVRPSSPQSTSDLFIVQMTPGQEETLPGTDTRVGIPRIRRTEDDSVLAVVKVAAGANAEMVEVGEGDAKAAGSVIVKGIDVGPARVTLEVELPR